MLLIAAQRFALGPGYRRGSRKSSTSAGFVLKRAKPSKRNSICGLGHDQKAHADDAEEHASENGNYGNADDEHDFLR
jgi:hypothetical protein